MTRIDKLYTSLLANPRAPIPFRDFEENCSAPSVFVHVRTKGSHAIWTPPETPPAPSRSSRPAKDAKTLSGAGVS